MTENKNTSLKATFTLHEIKPLVIDCIEEAHNIRNGFCLSKCKQYNLWHSPLIKFYKKYKTIQPTMADKLCFVILLSYPTHIIQSLNDILNNGETKKELRIILLKEHLSYLLKSFKDKQEQGLNNFQIIKTKSEVYGTFFEIKGDVATPFQFYLTDSTKYFVSGVVYFNCTPNYDSLKPSIDYLKKDLMEIKSFKLYMYE
jgi:gliding motility-associated lipoprotein GldD